MPVGLTAGILLGLFLCPVARAEEPHFIQTLQVRGTSRRVELETHAGQPLDPARVRRDVRRLWATGLFEDVRVESTASPEGVQLVFTLIERPRLYLGKVEFEPKGERWPLGLEPGAPVDAVLAQRVATGVRRTLREDGYLEAGVRAELIPAGFQLADLRIQIERGPRTTVETVRFVGNPQAEADDLRGLLPSVRVRRLLPGVPGVWSGWQLRPGFSRKGLEADLKRLHSWYLAQGFFDAAVRLEGAKREKDKATITVRVDAGPRYRVRRVEVPADTGSEPEAQLYGSLPARELCACLLEARRRAEGEGRLDLSTRVDVAEAAAPPWSLLDSAAEVDRWVALTANVEAGPAYTVRRIEFRGQHSVSDATLRRALQLKEGELFNLRRLRGSLARLSQLPFLEPPTDDAVLIQRDPERQMVDLTLRVKEKPRGRWTLSGPLGPTSLAGPLSYSIGARLPAWGQGPLELSTYAMSFHLIAFSFPALEALSVVPRTRWLPLLTLERPYMPGQRLQSGFMVAPQLGWKATPSSYLLTQLRQAARSALSDESAGQPPLAVPVFRARHSSELAAAGFLLCEPAGPRWGWLRAAALTAMDLLLATRPL